VGVLMLLLFLVRSAILDPAGKNSVRH